MSTQIKDNLSVTRNATVGGNLTACGNVTVKRGLVVEGWLDAKHLKTPCKGLFADAEALERACPNPRPGHWALVGNSIPAEVYIVTPEGWTATGEMGGATDVDLNYYDEKIDEVNDQLSGLQDSVNEQIDEVNDHISDLQGTVNDQLDEVNGHISDLQGAVDTLSQLATGAHPVQTRKISDADLIIADENEQPIITVSGGHIRTANFNSANITSGGGSYQPSTDVGGEQLNGGTQTSVTGCTMLRVMTWNIGHFAWGAGMSTAVTSADYAAKLAMWQKAIARYKPDVLALQEYENVFCESPSAQIGNVILNGYNIYPKNPEGIWRRNAVASLLPQSRLYNGEVTGEYISECAIVVGSKRVYLCAGHAPWESVGDCRAFHQALIDRYADKDYVIIGLDTNVRAEDGFLKELKAMYRKAGFQMANWGHWGNIQTYLPPDNVCLQCLDNVFVKGGTIVHAEAYIEVPDGSDADPEDLTATLPAEWKTVNPSDHAPLIADIILR